MPREGYKTVNIPAMIAKAVENSEVYRITNPKSFHSWVIETIENTILKERFLEKYMPKLSLVSVANDSIIIRDKKARGERLAEITIINDAIWCQLDRSENCQHIRYVLALPELGKIVKHAIRK